MKFINMPLSEKEKRMVRECNESPGQVSGLRGESLDRVVGECVQKELALTTENKRQAEEIEVTGGVETDRYLAPS